MEPIKPNAPPAPPRVATPAALLKTQLSNAWNRAESLPDVCVIDHGETLLVHNVRFVAFTNTRAHTQDLTSPHFKTKGVKT